MDKLTRRNLLRTLAGALAGTVVIARTPFAEAHGAPPEDPDHASADVRARAAKLDQSDSDPNDVYAQFRNVFRNGGGFRNGGFRNGGFRNGGFRNGGFRNGGFRNGGFRNGGFRNGGFRNGGFRNGGFRNAGGGFRNVFRNF